MTTSREPRVLHAPIVDRPWRECHCPPVATTAGRSFEEEEQARAFWSAWVPDHPVWGMSGDLADDDLTPDARRPTPDEARARLTGRPAIAGSPAESSVVAPAGDGSRRRRRRTALERVDRAPMAQQNVTSTFRSTQ